MTQAGAIAKPRARSPRVKDLDTVIGILLFAQGRAGTPPFIRKYE
jgi:hypothetical protein